MLGKPTCTVNLRLSNSSDYSSSLNPSLALHCLIKMDANNGSPKAIQTKFIHRSFSCFSLLNSYNSDGLSLMDVAVLTNNTEMVKLLIQQGAREGTECKWPSNCWHFVLLTLNLFPFFFSFSRFRHHRNQMAVKNRWICILLSSSTKLRNS